jgi:hypothetical protein
VKVMLVDNSAEQLPQGVVLKGVCHHRPCRYLGDHLGVVGPDKRIDPEQRISLARNPQFPL